MMEIFKNGKYIGAVEFLKNKNMYAIYFFETNYYADTLVGVNSLDEYLEDMGFQTEVEVEYR